MALRFILRDAAGVHGFDCAHGVAFDAGNLYEAADGVAGHAEVVFHADLGGMLHLPIGSVHGGHESTSGHGAGTADFALAAYLGTADRGVLFVENADRGGGEKI